MATYHSLNIALGVLTDGLVSGLKTAGAQLKQFTTSGMNVRGMVQFATASYGATKAVSSIAEGSKELAAALKASDTEGKHLYETMNGLAMAADAAGANVQKYGFVIGGLKSGFEAAKNFVTGDNSNLPRDAAADAAAAQMKKELEANQARYKEENDWKFKERTMLGKLRREMAGEEELNQLGARERKVVEARRGFGGLAGPEDAELRKMAREADQAERQKELTKRNSEKRVANALGVLADEQANSGKPSAGGGGGSTAALLMGSREEYVARMKAAQQADPEKKDDRRHKREVERAQKEANKWLRKLLEAQNGGRSIWGGV